MSELLAAFEGSVEFANPEYLMVVPVAALLLVFGLVVFGLQYVLRPGEDPWVVVSACWSHQILVSCSFCPSCWWRQRRRVPSGSTGPRASSGVMSMWRWRSTSRPRCGSRISADCHASKSGSGEVLNLYTQEILTPGDRVALFVFGTTAVRKVHLSSDAERFINQVGRIAPPSTLSGRRLSLGQRYRDGI